MINVEDKWWQLMGNDGEWLVVGAWNHINFGDVTQNVGYSTSWQTTMATMGVCNGANIKILAIHVGQIKAKKKDAWHCRLCWNQGPKPKESTEPKLEEVLVEGYTSTASKLFSLISHRHLGLFRGLLRGGIHGDWGDGMVPWFHPVW